jgi:signal transduction histidine kinase
VGIFISNSLKKASELSGDRLEPLALVETNTKRMMNIINHLRIFSRQGKEVFTTVDVNASIEGCRLMVGEQFRLRNIELKLDLMEDAPKVMGNPNQVEQVVLNLLTNAKDAIEERGAGAKTPGVVNVSTRLSEKDGAWVEVLVQDTGKGISDTHVGRIFEPFFTTKEVGKGTGLGLSISYGIVKSHNGAMAVAETGSEGTTFRIRFPVSESIKDMG